MVILLFKTTYSVHYEKYNMNILIGKFSPEEHEAQEACEAL
jgi:hypothetical protein